MFNPFKTKPNAPFGLGAQKSKKDSRTIQYSDLAMGGAPLTKGGYDYAPLDEILNQAKVGICTSISIVKLREKETGKKYSPDFLYLCQKKFLDGNWQEGSAILHAFKAGNKYGFLPISEWTWTTDADRNLIYPQYAAKLAAVPDDEIQRLLKLCMDKLPGYAWVNPLDSQALAKAIDASKAGIIVRYECGDTWWLPSWFPIDINPLRKPKKVVSGHAIIMSKYDFTDGLYVWLVNSWSKRWNMLGLASVNLSTYGPTEAWTIVNKVLFVRDLEVGMMHEDVKRLQEFLNGKGYMVAQSGAGSPGKETEYFGQLTKVALQKYQRDNGIPSTGFFGPITRNKINSL